MSLPRTVRRRLDRAAVPTACAGSAAPIRRWAAAALLLALACTGADGASAWQVIEEYDATTGANRSFAELGVADGSDSARIGLSCEGGTMRVALYQKRAVDDEWLLPFNFTIGFAGGDTPSRHTKPELGTEALQAEILEALADRGHTALEFRTQMGLIADDLGEFTIPLGGVRSAMRRLDDCGDRER